MNWPTRQRNGPPLVAGTGASASAARAALRDRDTGAARSDAATAGASVRRVSNGLKELLATIEGVERGEVLDLAPVSQATVDFFTSRGFRIHSHDLLRAWREFLGEELEQKTARDARATTGDSAAGEEEDPTLRPARFFARHLWFEPRKFHGVLLWDSLDYLDPVTGAALVARLAEVLRPGAAALLHLHDKPPERFWRYRVIDAQTLDCLPAAAPVAFQRTIPNREIMNMFHDFRTSKTFVGRDQIREVLFLR
jgi:hypothetical protein